MIFMLLLSSIQLSYGLDTSISVPTVSTDRSRCKSCKVLVESFNEGIERTKNGNFGGGNTAWEEKNLLTYAKSELRFVEIHDSLCETTQNQDMCYHLSTEYEHYLKEWWTDNNEANLYQWFCIGKLKVCCPSKHYGPNCLQCKGYPNVCNSHGTCKGDGTRKGNGLCKCNNGYEGDNCDQCAIDYFVAINNDTFTCEKCDKSCEDGCTDFGPKGCNDCKDGWVYINEDRGCADINECFEKDVCPSQQFCVNNIGSYSCLYCDSSCKDCYGDGNDMCYNCAQGYAMEDKKCIVNIKWKSSNQWLYLIYAASICIATIIILKMNSIVASIIVIFIAICLLVAEQIL